MKPYIYLLFYHNMSPLISQNPYTGDINKTFETVSNEQLTTLIEKAHNAYISRKTTPTTKKKELFLRMADILDERIDAYAKIETIEM